MDQNKGLRATRAAQEKAKIVTMQSGIASRAIVLGSRLGWVGVSRQAGKLVDEKFASSSHRVDF